MGIIRNESDDKFLKFNTTQSNINNMQRFVTFLFGLLLGIFAAIADNKIPEYEISGAGTGAQGTYLVKVSILTKNKKQPDSELARAAVHGVLFRGFSNKELRQNQKPLAGSAAVEAQHTDYFNNFFSDGGAYINYVETVSGSREVVKSGKQYKVSDIVTVNKEQLRKDLEAAGIIRGLNSIF